MGGTKAKWINEPANLVTLCGSGTTGCHGHVEHHPTEAKAFGWSVSRNGPPPSDVPVLTQDGWVFLDNHGGWTSLEDLGVDIPNIRVA